jgi:hypothetical protein
MLVLAPESVAPVLGASLPGDLRGLSAFFLAVDVVYYGRYPTYSFWS